MENIFQPDNLGQPSGCATDQYTLCFAVASSFTLVPQF
jgi:hypothetical protein